MPVGRVDQYEWTVTCGGRYLGVWDDSTGGAITAKETKYRPGGMGSEVSLGGQKSVTNITLSKGFDRQRDADDRRYLQNSVGRQRCVATRQPLDADKNPYGPADVYQGVLNAFTPADAKADSNDADMYTIEISTDGEVA